MKNTIIACYSLDGKLIKTYKSASEASKSMKVFSRTIDKAIRENKLVHDKQWKRMDISNVPLSIEPYTKKTTVISIRPIAMIDIDNKVISVYPSIKKASETNKVDPHTIRDNLNGKTKSANGKKYRYLTEEEIDKYGYNKGQEISIKKVGVMQLDLNGKYIRSYKSISEACRELGRPNRSQEIRDCLNGKYSTAFGYIWKRIKQSNS